MKSKEIIDQINVAEKQFLLADKDNWVTAYNDLLKSFRPVNPETHLIDLWSTMVSELMTIKNSYIEGGMDKHNKLRLFLWLGHMKMFINSSHSN